MCCHYHVGGRSGNSCRKLKDLRSPPLAAKGKGSATLIGPALPSPGQSGARVLTWPPMIGLGPDRWLTGVQRARLGVGSAVP